MNRQTTLTASQLRLSDTVLLGEGRTALVGGVAHFDQGSKPDLHVLDWDGGYAFVMTPDESVRVVRNTPPMIAYTEFRFVHVGLLLLLDPRDPEGEDYDPNSGDMVPYRVTDWSRTPDGNVEVKAVPALRGVIGGLVVLCESPTFPLRLAEWPEVAVLTAERDAALERLDMIERDGVERPGVGAVA